MFRKLLKYEFKSQQKIFSVLSFAALGAGLVGGLVLWLLVDVLENVENSTAAAVGSILSTFLLIGVMLALVAYVIAVWIMLLYRFYKHHFSQEGYLTFTLPVTTHQTLLASILNLVIWELIALAVFACAICMIFAPSLTFAWKESIPEIKMVFRNFKEAFSYIEGGYLAVQILVTVSSWLYAVIVPLTCISLGCLLSKKYRILISFAIYYGLQLAVSMITGVISVIITVAGLAAGNEGDGLIYLSMVIPCVLQLGLAIGGYFLTHHMVKNKLNLP